jgi:hypothetical protein
VYRTRALPFSSTEIRKRMRWTNSYAHDRPLIWIFTTQWNIRKNSYCNIQLTHKIVLKPKLRYN